jgi:hypothetical protein
MAEGVGFEPTPRKNRGAVFKTATISHSVTPPGFKFYFKTTPSGNLADLLLASLPDFDPTWMIYEMADYSETMPTIWWAS